MDVNLGDTPTHLPAQVENLGSAPDPVEDALPEPTPTEVAVDSLTDLDASAGLTPFAAFANELADYKFTPDELTESDIRPKPIDVRIGSSHIKNPG